MQTSQYSWHSLQAVKSRFDALLRGSYHVLLMSTGEGFVSSKTQINHQPRRVSSSSYGLGEAWASLALWPLGKTRQILATLF